MSEFWYYAEGNDTRGPVVLDELIEILSHLPTSKEVFVWREGFDDWTAAENIHEIAEQLIRPAPLRRTPTTTPSPEAAPDWGLFARYQQQFPDGESVEDETVALDQQQVLNLKPAARAETNVARKWSLS